MGLTINTEKTKVMVVSKNPINLCELLMQGKAVEHVDKYRNLGTYITSNLDQDHEIKTRNQIARQLFL